MCVCVCVFVRACVCVFIWACNKVFTFEIILSIFTVIIYSWKLQNTSRQP